jgi:hypothetical protein
VNPDLTDLALTAENLKALRGADSVWFKHETACGDKTYVAATKRFDPKDGFGERDLTAYVPATPKFTLYDRNGSSGRRAAPTTAFYSAASAKFHPEWTTAAKLLKAGDRLVLHWTTDSNKRVVAAGLTLVEFRLEVRRATAKGREEHLCFHLGSVVEQTTSNFSLEF